VKSENQVTAHSVKILRANFSVLWRRLRSIT